MKLNGWQRIWVVIAIIYFIMVFGIVYFDIPSHAENNRRQALEMISKTIEIDQSLRNYTAWSLREVYSDKDDEFIIQALQNKYAKSAINPFEEIQNEYKIKNENLIYVQLDFIFYAFLFWSIPLVTLYLLGLTIGWILKGFRQKN